MGHKRAFYFEMLMSISTTEGPDVGFAPQWLLCFPDEN